MTEGQPIPAPRRVTEAHQIPEDVTFTDVFRGVRGRRSRNRFEQLTGIPAHRTEHIEKGVIVPTTYQIHVMCNRLGLDPNDPQRTLLQLSAVDARIAQGG